MKKIICVILTVVIFAGAFSVSVAAKNDPPEFLSATLINDYDILLTFSSGVYFNAKAPIDAQRPTVTLRLVDGEGKLVRDDKNNYLRWSGILRYADESREKIVLTPCDDNLSLTCAAEVVNKEGVFEQYSDLDAVVSIEEAIYSSGSGWENDGKVGNITDADGQMLTATVKGTFDKAVAEIETDYSVKLDESKYFGVAFGKAHVFPKIEYPDDWEEDETTAPETDASEPTDGGFDPLPLIIGGAVVLAVGFLCFAIFSKPKNKKEEKK